MTATVLFVDDEAAMLRALKREFSSQFDLSVAYSAAEGRSLLAGDRRFDVVVTDVSMPEMNGLDFIEAVAPLNPDTRFVVLTGNCDAATFDRARGLPNVVRALSKPADRETILEAITTAAAAAIGRPVEA